jgi:hypothetical protein
MVPGKAFAMRIASSVEIIVAAIEGTTLSSL